MSTKRAMVKCSKSNFSYIEILVSIAILMMIAGLFAVNIRRVYNEQVFSTETKQLINQIETAADLAVIFGIDSEIQFTTLNGQLKSNWIATGVTTETFERLFNNSNKKYSFQATLNSFRGPEENFAIVFKNRGYNNTLGVLKIEGIETLYLALPGYPSPLNYSKEPLEYSRVQTENFELYDKLTPFVMGEL